MYEEGRCMHKEHNIECLRKGWFFRYQHWTVTYIAILQDC